MKFLDVILRIVESNKTIKYKSHFLQSYIHNESEFKYIKSYYKCEIWGNGE